METLAIIGFVVVFITLLCIAVLGIFCSIVLAYKFLDITYNWVNKHKRLKQKY